MASNVISLVDRHPTLDAAEIVASLVPPLHFETASFDSYVPDADFPSQDSTRVRLSEFASSTVTTLKPNKLFARAKKGPAELPGIYLDGGFGVGKTHLLAAAWNVAGGRKYFGTFLQYTSLVGALGYAKAVEAMKGASLICIDEFELDDPGDTMMMTRMLGELMATGTRVAATSNTPPQALGEGRFAAADFLREIHALAANFETIRIDGTDYRRRTSEGLAGVYTNDELAHKIADANDGTCIAQNSFDDVLGHLGSVHPSTYLRLIKGVQILALNDVHVIMNQTDALRLVAFIDRVYDAQIPIWSTGTPLSEVFGGDMINGGYRKKYLRCVSRLIALTNA